MNMGHFETFFCLLVSKNVGLCPGGLCFAAGWARASGTKIHARGGAGGAGRQNIGMMETRSQSQWEFQDPNMSHITFT